MTEDFRLDSVILIKGKTYRHDFWVSKATNIGDNVYETPQSNYQLWKMNLRYENANWFVWGLVELYTILTHSHSPKKKP